MLVPSGRNMPGENAMQACLEFSYARDNHFFSVGAFGKKMDNLVYYKYAQSLFNGALSAWEENIDVGRGHAYGSEFMYEFSRKDLSARLTYTISKTTRDGFERINEGKTFHARFDRTHVFFSNITWKGFSASVTAQSGHWENGAPVEYQLHTPVDTWVAKYYSGVNNYHMPMVFRLDLGYNINLLSRRCNHDITIGVFNVTNHFNPFALYFDSKTEIWKEVAMLPIMPNFNYIVSF